MTLPVTPPVGSPLVRVEGLTVDFATEDGRFVAVEDLDFHISSGETLAVVGESGSGKSVTSLALMRLVEFGGGRIAGGRLIFRGRDGVERDLSVATIDGMTSVRGNDVAMIFQEPMTSLNPIFTIGDQIGEVVRLHRGASKAEARAEALAMLKKVRIPDAERLLDRHPHQLSGGMRQRVMIAMALACRPKLLIADEPTTALDVTIQAQILGLVRALQDEMDMAVMFITHDMGVVAEVADRVLVMRHGRKVEEGPVAEIFARPQHPYTKALLAAVPRLGALTGEDLPRRFPLLSSGEATVAAEEAKPQDTVLPGGPILSVRDLVTRFEVRNGFFGRVSGRVHAVEKVSFDVARGETIALVGESGCGKSTTGRTIMQLLEPDSGSVHFHGRDIFQMSREERRRIR